MKISHGTRFKTTNPTNGYGYATQNVLASLDRLGYETSQNDPSADVEIWFDQPQHWNFTKGVYRIGYHPWESTELHPKWVEKMNECDEIWTPSPLIAKWYKEYGGIKVPVYVYEHGVDPVWTPKVRKVDGTLRFLHVGAESLRKGGPETLRAFRYAFPKKDGVGLTMKMISDGWNFPEFNGITVVNRTLGLQELIQLYHDHHVFVYPSWGEGFGLTPLQAIATGMPAIATSQWAPYRGYLNPFLTVRSRLVDSPWPTIHPGKMLEPHIDDVVDHMREVRNNYDWYASEQLKRVDRLVEEYSWDKKTAEVFAALKRRL